MHIEKTFNEHCDKLNTEIEELKKAIAFRDAEIEKLKKETPNPKIEECEGRIFRCEKLISDLKEDQIDSKCRSMKNSSSSSTKVNFWSSSSTPTTELHKLASTTTTPTPYLPT